MKRILDYWKLKRENNTLKLQCETLEETIKSDLYKEFMKRLGEPNDLERLQKENLYLREKLKSYKEDMKNGNNKIEGRRKKDSI